MQLLNVKEPKNFLLILVLLFSYFYGFGQKNKDIIPVIECVKDLRNGMYQATFGYENPTKKTVYIDENGSIIKYNKGKKIAKGLNKFEKGTNNKTFTKEFGAKDYVEWTIISNGNTHTVVANANSAKCDPEDGLIVPVIGNGKSFDLIGQELTSICENPVDLIPSPLIFQIKEDKILIEIVPQSGQLNAVINLLKGPSFSIDNNDFLMFDATNPSDLTTQLSQYVVIDVFFKKEALCDLNNYPFLVNFARPVYPANISSGGVVTQGDAAQKSNIVRESFRMVNGEGEIVPVDGRGISIAVLSDSYDMALPGEALSAIDISNSELPDDVIVLKDNASQATDEGRAMMQIIHDVAPGASLKFHTATASPRQFEEGVYASAENDIIVDDITFITEPFFIGNSRIADAIQTFLSEPGKFHFTSAGNLANKGYQSTFSSSSEIPVTNFLAPGSTRAHLFDGNGGADYLQEFSVKPGTYLIALQWEQLLASQGSSGALDDLDIYIVDDLGRLLVGSNRVNIEGDPTEIIVFRATGTGTANLLITSANGETSVPFRYIAFYTTADDGSSDGLKITEYFGDGAPTVSGHAMISGSVTVGAVDYRLADNPVAESFSSYGGALTDGSELFIDIYAPDGGNTSSTTIGQDAQCSTCDNDGILNFYGTSASAPHMAGAAALLMSAAPSWFPDGAGSTTFTTDQAIQLFKGTAKPFAAADGSAAEFLNTFAAFDNVASQTARITDLIVEDGKTPSAEPFTVSIIGEFFPDEPGDLEIYFDEQPLEDVQISTVEGNKIITATVPTFSGNPALYIVTNSITPGGTDGGESDPAYFFDDGKLALTIIAKNAQFEYGQDIGPAYYRPDTSLPDYQRPYTVEGLPEGINFESLTDLPSVVLNNVAIDEKLAQGDYPIVSEYVITPSFGGQDYDQDLYQINFVSGYVDPDPEIGKVGYVTITKKDLIIRPYPAEAGSDEAFIYTYGDPIDLTLNYLYDGTGITDNSPETGFYNVLESSHIGDFKDGLPNKFRAVVSKFRAVVSTETVEYDLLDLLDGGSWSISDRTLQNKFRAVVSGMSIIDLENDDFVNYIDARSDFDAGETNKFRAVVSKFRAVVSSEDLFAGDIDLGIENKFRAVVSKFRAVVSSENPERPYSNYESVFSIIDAEDAPPEDGSDEQRAISNIYALNMITGLDVTKEGESHFVYPGAFLNATSANFNITYIPGRLIILPKALIASTNNLTISYGTALSQEDLMTSFDGWAFEGEFKESKETVFPQDSGGITYYFVKVGDGDETPIAMDELKELGDYFIRIKNPKNYLVNHTVNESLGVLTIEAAPLIFDPDPIMIAYGEDIESLAPNFEGFAEGEDEEVLKVNGKVPYYFMKDGDPIKYTIGGDDRMEVGLYEIFMTDDPADNYKILPAPDRGQLTVEKAILDVLIKDQLINQGEVPLFESEISGYVYDDMEEAVFPSGITYYFVDEDDQEQNNDQIGVFTVKIREEPLNYLIHYVSENNLFINLFDSQLRKIRNYLDCIVYVPDDPSGYNYIARFSYENPNSNSIYVLPGEDNNITGDASYSGELPFVFLPGEGSFEILFDGNLLKWNLTTFDSTHKTSTSATANADSRKCSGGYAEGDPSYSVFPNPVETILTIEQNERKNSEVYIYNLNGVLKYQSRFTKNGNNVKYIDMTGYTTGFYYVRIITNKDEKVYHIVKQ